MSKADEMFEELDYIKIHCKEGFFWHNNENNKVVLFNLNKHEWSVYDYDTEKSLGYGDKLLKAILQQELELKWINKKEYDAELW